MSCQQLTDNTKLDSNQINQIEELNNLLAFFSKLLLSKVYVDTLYNNSIINAPITLNYQSISLNCLFTPSIYRFDHCGPKNIFLFELNIFKRFFLFSYLIAHHLFLTDKLYLGNNYYR